MQLSIRSEATTTLATARPQKGPKPRVVTVGEEFKLECSNDEHKDILKLLVEHELEATAKGKVAFWSLKLGIRTYRLLGNNFPVGGKKATFDIRDIKARRET